MPLGAVFPRLTNNIGSVLYVEYGGNQDRQSRKRHPRQRWRPDFSRSEIGEPREQQHRGYNKTARANKGLPTGKLASGCSANASLRHNWSYRGGFRISRSTQTPATSNQDQDVSGTGFLAGRTGTSS
jgi:hypothetical protein